MTNSEKPSAHFENMLRQAEKSGTAEGATVASLIRSAIDDRDPDTSWKDIAEAVCSELIGWAEHLKEEINGRP
jgi:hypothetical protein